MRGRLSLSLRARGAFRQPYGVGAFLRQTGDHAETQHFLGGTQRDEAAFGRSVSAFAEPVITANSPVSAEFKAGVLAGLMILIARRQA
jgi:hypothetical protein